MPYLGIARAGAKRVVRSINRPVSHLPPFIHISSFVKVFVFTNDALSYFVANVVLVVIMKYWYAQQLDFLDNCQCFSDLLPR